MGFCYWEHGGRGEFRPKSRKFQKFTSDRIHYQIFQVDCLRDDLQLSYRGICDRGDIATEDEMSNLMYLQRQLYFARTQLSAHLHEQAVRLLLYHFISSPGFHSRIRSKNVIRDLISMVRYSSNFDL